MNNHRSRNILRVSVLAGLVLLSAWAAGGCASFGRGSRAPLVELTQGELDRFLDANVDPRTRGITLRRGIAGPEFEFANRPWLRKSAILPLRRADSRFVPAVEATLPDKTKFLALVDTSARQSWLRYESVPALGYRAFREEPSGDPVGEYADHVRSSIPGYAGVVSKFLLGKLYVETPVFYVPPGHGPLVPWTRAEPPSAAWPGLRSGLHAVFGSALLSNFTMVRLDFRSGQAVWTTSDVPAPPPKALVAPMGDWRGRPTVRIRAGGKDVEAVIDTAGDFGLAIPARELSAELPPEGVEMPVEWGGVALETPIAITTLEREGLPADWPPRLGWRFWRDGALTLDYSRHRVCFESPAVPARPDADAAADPGASSGDAPQSPRYRGVRP